MTIRRLAPKARESGVKLFRDPKDGRAGITRVPRADWGTCITSPPSPAPVPALPTTVGASITRRSCRPSPGSPTEADPQPILCDVRRGVGTHPGTTSTGRGWAYANVICEACHGTGQAMPQQTPAA